MLPSQPTIHYVPKTVLPDWFRQERTRVLTDPSLEIKVADDALSTVVYWMQRDVRTVDNWALCLAASLVAKYELGLHVVYVLPPPPNNEGDKTYKFPPQLIDLNMTSRHGHFLLGGLEHVHRELATLNIPLHVVKPASHRVVGYAFNHLVKRLRACLVVSDLSPLRHFREWTEIQAVPLLEKQQIPLYQVDAHNIVPVWVASDKQESAARLLRPKIQRQLQHFLKEYPRLTKNRFNTSALPRFDRPEYETYMQMDTSVPVIDSIRPGTKAGMEQFKRFLSTGLSRYQWERNNPVKKESSSRLSPWINHGHVSFQRIVMEVKKLKKYDSSASNFLEQGIIRRELCDNYVFFDPYQYDSLKAAPDWAFETLQEHALDKRQPCYSLAQLESGHTHDSLWNAAQLQMVYEGGMHNNLRMYWAKKILEWTESPDMALRSAQYLNDKYALDGRDPNGFVGVGWCIMAIHDRPFPERNIYGKIRYKNDSACKKR